MRARVPELLTLDDEELIAAVGGAGRQALAAELETFDPQAAWAAAASAGLSAVCRHAPDYPSVLKALSAPPAALYVAGEPRRLAAMLGEPAVAVVGARRASPYGIEVARSLARDLSIAGVTVVSGMAYGVDGAAHRGALEDRPARSRSSPEVQTVPTGCPSQPP